MLKFVQRFSTISMARGALYKQVAREYKYETDSYEQEKEIFTKLDELGFQYEDDIKTNKIILKKSFPTVDISIQFAAVRPPKGVETIEKEEEDVNSDEDNSQLDLLKKKHEKENPIEAASLSVDYTVFVKSQKGEAIAFECNTKNAVTTINFIQPVYDMEAFMNKTKVQKFLLDYTGPDVNNLESKLKQSLYDYLYSFNITPELNSIIETYALDKEQRLYMEFLKKMDRFLS